ncbi:MAG: hypothetical protein GEV03_12585 [Streptosporangiales bacterium]|nr:hypothetical protein [Streptosporangiales bacterium]
MRRLFYLAAGVAIGVAATRRVNRAVRAWTPQGLADGLGETARNFAAEVRAGMAERENELREAFAEQRGDDTDTEVRKAR